MTAMERVSTPTKSKSKVIRRRIGVVMWVGVALAIVAGLIVRRWYGDCRMPLAVPRHRLALRLGGGVVGACNRLGVGRRETWMNVKLQPGLRLAMHAGEVVCGMQNMFMSPLTILLCAMLHLQYHGLSRCCCGVMLEMPTLIKCAIWRADWDRGKRVDEQRAES